jgi:hypothetical protein
VSDSPESVDTEPLMVGRRPVDQPTPMPKAGAVFADRYTIDCQLGKGGMGVVYKAEQAPLGRQVAIKILKPPDRIEDDPKFDERFMREAAAAAKLHHGNTITIHDFGQTERGQLFIVMEYLEGRDLHSVLRAGGPFPPERAIHVAVQICKSLREAHGMGMVHRDLKPANVVLIDREGDTDFVKVLDFGLVKYAGEESELTLAGKFVGSPKYTSPEALDRTKKIDHRADIYSLGILIYTMLAGQPPFSGDPIQVLTSHLREEPPLLRDTNPLARSTPRLDLVIARCLKKDPEERFGTMEALLEALLASGPAHAQGEQTSTLVLSGDLPAAPRKSVAGRGMGMVLLVAGAVIVLGLALMLFGPSEPAAPSPEPGPTLEDGAATQPGAGATDPSGAGATDPSGAGEASGGEGAGGGDAPGAGPAKGDADPSAAQDQATPAPAATPPSVAPESRAPKAKPPKSPRKDSGESEGYKSNPY